MNAFVTNPSWRVRGLALCLAVLAGCTTDVESESLDETDEIYAAVCVAGAKRCTGNTPQTCNASGQWVSSAPCAFKCTAGSCRNFVYRVGRPVRVYGPDSALPDSHFVAVTKGTVVRGYTSGGTTKVFEGSSVETLAPVGVALQPGASNRYDACGAWLNSVEAGSGSTVRGWYHAEEKCNYDNGGQTHMSIAYAESSDGGRTFTKVGYPDNRVLTGNSVPAAGKITGNGLPSVIQWRGQYWMYFMDPTQWGVGVARAALSTFGRPGAWTKLLNGSFSSPGLGGAVSKLAVPPTGTQATIHTPTDQVVLAGTTPNGLRLSFSTSGTTFHTMSDPLVPFEEENWNRPAPTELMAYPSVVPPGGGSSWSNQFHLFHSYLPPSATFATRYLVRRKVTVSETADLAAPQGLITLSRYHAASRNDSWTTTTVPLDGTYAFQKDLGFLLTAQRAGTVPLYDCYFAEWDDHMVSPVVGCEGMTRLRTLGWMYSPHLPQPANTKPLYRCYHAPTTNHSVSDAATCEGLGGVEWLLGYVVAS
jgi:hypothetical protein